MAIALLYHDVVPAGQDDTSGFPGPGAARYKLTPAEFREHVRSIAAVCHAFAARPSPAGPSDAPGSAKACHPSSAELLLTFDDGGASAFDPVADLLEAQGWRGHFFITTGSLDKPAFLTAGQVRSLYRRGHVIGSHSHSHPARMALCGPDELLREWRTSCAALSDLLGTAVTTASVPGGFYSRAVAEAAAQAGIRLLFNSEPTTRTQAVNGCQVVGRYTVYRGMSARAAAALAAGQRTSQVRQALFWNVKKLAKAVGGRAYLSLRNLLLARAYARGGAR
jgi:peptidoglycan/xylan/chitin deacetylase (PgdA/CDA1 family)